MYSIILPIYNEIENMERLIPEIFETINIDKIEIIVVDDNSIDGSDKVILNLKKKYESLIYYKRPNQVRSLGKSVEDGIKISRYQYLILMDSDFSHGLEDLKEMINTHQKKQLDLICYSRFSNKKPHDFRLRYELSKYYNLILKPFLNLPTTDSLSGFFLVNKKKMKDLPNEKIFYGYGDYYFRLLHHINKKQINYEELSFKWKDRKYGKSKTKFINIFLRYTYEAIKLKLKL